MGGRICFGPRELSPGPGLVEQFVAPDQADDADMKAITRTTAMNLVWVSRRWVGSAAVESSIGPAGPTYSPIVDCRVKVRAV